MTTTAADLPQSIQAERDRVNKLAAAYRQCLKATEGLKPDDVANTLVAVAGARGAALIRAEMK